MKNKKKIAFFLIITLMCILSIFIIIVGVQYKKINNDRKVALGIDDLIEVEEKFKKEPTLNLSVELMDKYLHIADIKDYNKALLYGYKAIELGSNDTAFGISINIWMSYAYYNLNKPDKACQFVKKAFSIDKENIIQKYNYLEQEGFDSNFLEKCLIK